VAERQPKQQWLILPDKLGFFTTHDCSEARRPPTPTYPDDGRDGKPAFKTFINGCLPFVDFFEKIKL